MRDVFRHYFISINLERSLYARRKASNKTGCSFSLSIPIAHFISFVPFSLKNTREFSTHFLLFLSESFSAFLTEMILVIREEGVVKLSLVFTALGHIAVDDSTL